MKNIVIAAALAASFAGAASAEPAAEPAPKTQKYIVTFDPKAKKADREQALAAFGLKAAKHIQTSGDTELEVSVAVIELPAGADPKAALAEQACVDPDPAVCQAAVLRVLSIEKDQRIKWIESAQVSFQAAPLPSLGSVMGGLDLSAAKRLATGQAAQMRAAMAAVRPELPWGVNRVHAPAAWDFSEAAGVRVAVIDTGIDLTHPELVGKVDGGFSAVTNTENPEDFADDNGHGTHVAGTIAAARDGRGVVGVAPKARLYSVKVLDADGSGTLSGVINGIVWAAENDMQVANMSLGAPVDSPAMARAVRYARAVGVIVVAAAGNSGGSVGFPGAYPDAIGVSASDYQDKLAVFSSRGPEVDFIAPGVDVVSAKNRGGFVSYSGTSMAAPHVAGMAALAVSQGYVGLHGPDGVFAQLKKAARPLPNLSAEEQGSGMIDAGRLVR